VSALIDTIDAYCDAAPRSSARTEEHGDLVVFIREGDGWPFYARPARGRRGPTSHAVAEVRARQRSLGIPEAFEWIHEAAPGMKAAVLAAKLTAHDHPLMVLDGPPPAATAPEGIEIRLVAPDEPLDLIQAVAPLAFSHPGTQVGDAGPEQAAQAAGSSEDDHAFLRERLGSGTSVLAAAFADGVPVATGMHQPVEDVSEVAGIGTLPAFRRRGIGAALTGFLVRDAQARGVATVFLTAGDEEIARVYASQGFARIGTAGTAEP
jgi:ribosomal protein S18 acetylase RimI-like enzyme